MESNAWVENVSTVQRLYAAFGRGDIGSVIAALSPDVVWGEPDNPFNPAAGTWRGHAGFLEWASIGRQSEEILQLEPRQFIAQGDMVAVVGHTACIARPTGRGYETDFVHLVTLRGERSLASKNSSTPMWRPKPSDRESSAATTVELAQHRPGAARVPRAEFVAGPLTRAEGP